MDTIRYGSYRFGTSYHLTEEHFGELTSIFNTPPLTQNVNIRLSGRVSASSARLTGIGPIIVKHYRRGGLLSYLMKRSYLKWGKTRCQVEYDQLQNACHSGISVPEPIAYAYKGLLFYQAWLITREIPNPLSLANLSILDTERTLTAQKKLIEQMALLIDNNIYHTDLHPGNVLVDSKNCIFIIDFDKAHLYMKSKTNLQKKYIQRWNRAVLKHKLPETLYWSATTFPFFFKHDLGG